MLKKHLDLILELLFNEKFSYIFFIFFFILIPNAYPEIYFIDLDKIINQSDVGKIVNQNILEENKKVI